MAVETAPEELLLVDEALDKLEAQDPDKARLVKLRFFSGLTNEEAAAALDISRGISFYDEVSRFEIELIRRALDITGGHQSRAAKLLGMNNTTLNSKIKVYNIKL